MPGPKPQNQNQNRLVDDPLMVLKREQADRNLNRWVKL